jgi:hypothetical protein
MFQRDLLTHALLRQKNIGGRLPAYERNRVILTGVSRGSGKIAKINSSLKCPWAVFDIYPSAK